MLGIGELIRINRDNRGINQEELSYGICSTANLSKIERGKQVPTRATFEALMQRMGMSAGVYPSFLNNADKRAFELKHDFNERFAKEQYDEAEKALNDLDKIPKLDMVYEHFIRMAKILIKQINGLSPKEAIKEYENAIGFFIKDFSVDNIRRYHLTKTEINMFNALSVAHHRAGNADIAIKILYELMVYVESKVYDNDSITIVYTKVLYHLSKYVGLSGDDKEAVKLCDKGIDFCIRYGRYTNFANLLYNKGYGLMNLGKKDEAEKCIRECYYIMSALGGRYAKEFEFLKNYAEEKGIKLL